MYTKLHIGIICTEMSYFPCQMYYFFLNSSTVDVQNVCRCYTAASFYKVYIFWTMDNNLNDKTMFNFVFSIFSIGQHLII